MVDIKVLENGEKRSFFSILAPRVVKVELIVKENAENHANNEKIEKIKQEKNLFYQRRTRKSNRKCKKLYRRVKKPITRRYNI